jgi:hypothetical protein
MQTTAMHGMGGFRKLRFVAQVLANPDRHASDIARRDGRISVQTGLQKGYG